MRTHYLADIERGISTPRLAVYAQSAGVNHEAVVNYFWNISLCEALYPALDALEVTLRNAIHDAATAAYGTEMWFDLPGVLKFGQPKQVLVAKNALRSQGKPLTAGRIIAELRFGFWTALLSGPYHSHLWMPHQARLLKHVFPNMTNARRIRTDIHRRYDDLRLLRNRVFHYEPIWNRPDLHRDHERLVETVGWINTTVMEAILLIDRFDDTFQHGRGRISFDLQARFSR